MEDINKAIDTIKNLLQTEEGKQTLNSLIQNIAGNSNSTINSEQNTYSNSENSIPMSANSNPGNLAGGFGNFSELLASVQNGNNAPRMQLLGALRPYLSNKRQQKYGTLMNLMKYSEVPAALFGRLNKR